MDRPPIVLRLTPSNADAKLAFNDTASAHKDKSGAELLHASRFMAIEPYRQEIQVPEPVTGKSTAGTEDTETDTATEVETDAEGQAVQLKWQGSYNISFGVRPNFPLIGWVVGVGRWHGKGSKPNGGVDLQLAPPRTAFSKYEVAGRHARFFIDETGSFTICTVSDRSPRIRLGVEEFFSGQRVITERSCQISFGKLDYVLEFVVDDEHDYQRSLRQYLKNHLLRPPAPPDLSATPSPWDSKLGYWLVRGTVGKGSFATVSAAKHTVTGEAGAAKFMVRTQETQKAIAQEIDILKSLPNHFHDVQYERGEKWFCAPSDEDDERHSFKARPEKVAIIYSPFARATITECLNDLSISLRLVAFHELIQGVSALHSAGLIHRDIKPGNWGVVNLTHSEISTVILDYGQAVRAVSCEPKPGLVGTVPYLAPEMELRTYGPGVDIWACGVIGLQLFVTAGILQWKNVTHERRKFELVVTALQDEPADSVSNLLSQMLVWDPSERVLAEVALGHACFSGLHHNHSSAEVNLGLKRRRSPP
ncbi:hypothetical protein ACEPPN_006516 [Leptodophora sp. 'Broadleaf-Isolate-01']